MRFFLFSSIFIFSFIKLFSQPIPKVDSLRNILKKEKQDTNTVQALYKLCFILKDDSSLVALSYGKKALELAIKIDYKKGIASSYNNLGAVYDGMGEQEKAIKYFLKSYELKKSTNDYKGLANTLSNIGVIYKRDLNYIQALYYFSLAGSYSDKINNPVFIGKLNFNLANLYIETNKNDSALKLLKSLRLNNKLRDDTLFQMDIFKSISTAYTNISKPTIGLAYIDSAMHLNGLSRKNKKIHLFYIQKASCFDLLNELDSSKIYFNKIITTFKDTSDYAFLQQVYYKLSKLYKKLYDKKQKTTDLELSYNFLNLCINNREKAYNIKKSAMISDLVLKSEINIMENEIENISNQKEISDLKSKNQKNIIIFICLIAVTILLLLLILYKRFSISKRLNKELEEKNNIIQDKNSEIISSIQYAKRIQNALLPQEKFIERKINDLKK